MISSTVCTNRMVFAIDPGATGAVASLCASAPEPIKTLSILPFSSKRIDVLGALWWCVGQSRPFSEVNVLVERAFIMPGSGVKQSMTYMEHYGVLIGALLSMRVPESSIHELAPQQWQRHVRSLVPARAKKGERAAQAAEAGMGVEEFSIKARAVRRKSIKENSRTIAARIFPHMAHEFKRVKDDGKADAALMAYVCLHFFTTSLDAPPRSLVP